MHLALKVAKDSLIQQYVYAGGSRFSQSPPFTSDLSENELNNSLLMES